MWIAARIAALAAAAMAIIGLSGCEMMVIPLTAQAGSTVVIPMGNATLMDTFGYGGDPSDPDAVIDYQRGQLVMKLHKDSPTGDCPETGPCYLVARAASQAVGSESTYAAIFGANAGREALAIFDLPPDAQPGTYHLELFRRLLAEDGSGGFTEEAVITSTDPVDRVITILPYQLDPDKNWKACGGSGQTQCGPQVVTGGSTPYEYWSTGGGTGHWSDGSSFASISYPSPEVIFNVPFVRGSGVFALELDIFYPNDKITVLDVVHPIRDTNFVPPNARPIVIAEDDPTCATCVPTPTCAGGVGTVPPSPGKVHVVMVVKPGSQAPVGNQRISQLGMVFDLLVGADGSFSRLDPDADLCVNVLVGADEDGNSLTPMTVWPQGVI